MSSPTPAVAVVIISYNGEAFLPTSIASVLNQTVTDLELVVVEDGTHDSAEQIVKSFNDPRVRYVWRENGGTSAGRNTGIGATTAPLIAFLDCDDWWDPRKLETQLAALAARPDAGVVYSAATMVVEGTAERWIDPAVVEGDAMPQLMLRNCISGSASSVMMKRSMIDQVGRFDESLRYAEDWEYWLRLAKATPYARVEEPLVFIRARPGSLGRHTDNLRRGAHQVINRAYANTERKYRRLRHVAHANIEFGASLDLSHHGRRRDAMIPLLRAIGYDPFRLMFWRRLILMVLSKIWPTQSMRRRIVTAESTETPL